MLQQFDPRNRNLLINVNGRLTPRDEPSISPFDSVVQGGDAVWEGLRLYDGRIFRLDEHLDRLEQSARALAFEALPSREQIVEEIKKTLAANQMRDEVHIRLTLTRGVKITSGMDPRLNQSGPTLIVLAEYKAPVYDKQGIRLVTSSYRRPGPNVLDPKIHHNNLLNSILAKIEANAVGVDDALMLDGRGMVAETNATHVFAVLEGVVTTSLPVACPEGITRSVVLELCEQAAIPHAQRDLSLKELYQAEEAFCTGTMGELAPISEIDARRIGNPAERPICRQLTHMFRELTASTGAVVA